MAIPLQPIVHRVASTKLQHMRVKALQKLLGNKYTTRSMNSSPTLFACKVSAQVLDHRFHAASSILQHSLTEGAPAQLGK